MSFEGIKHHFFYQHSFIHRYIFTVFNLSIEKKIALGCSRLPLPCTILYFTNGRVNHRAVLSPSENPDHNAKLMGMKDALAQLPKVNYDTLKRIIGHLTK